MLRRLLPSRSKARSPRASWAAFASMDLSTLASIGEFAGAIAVVVSLLYLSTQIRHNSRVVKSAALQALNDTAIQALSGMAAPGTVEVVTKGLQDLDQLNPTERFQVMTHISILLIGFQNNFYQYKAGLLPESVFRRQLGVARWWTTTFKGVRQSIPLLHASLDPEFARLLRLPAPTENAATPSDPPPAV